MTRTILYLIFLFPLFYSCTEANGKTETTSTNSEETVVYDYKFEDGEQIHWEAAIEGEYVVIRSWLNTDWNTYSVYNTNFLGPLPTLISFDPNDAYELVGNIKEEGLKTKFDEESNSELGYFEHQALFKQKIKVNSGEEFVLKGNVNYMICNASGCLPPTDYDFELIVKP